MGSDSIVYFLYLFLTGPEKWSPFASHHQQKKDGRCRKGPKESPATLTRNIFGLIEAGGSCGCFQDELDDLIYFTCDFLIYSSAKVQEA